MANQAHYTLLSTAVQIANAANLSPIARLKSLARLIKRSFHLHSVTIYLLDAERRTLSRMISAEGPAKILSCHIPLGEQTAGLCALRERSHFFPKRQHS